MKLISMADFVLEQVKNAKYEEFHQVNETFVNKVINYAQFLKQPLELWMFVPCDEDGNVLEHPKNYHKNIVIDELKRIDNYNNLIKEYEQAKERCLFEGFEWKVDESFAEEVNGIFDKKTNRFICALDIGMTIEDLVCIKSELTPTAIKQLEI